MNKYSLKSDRKSKFCYYLSGSGRIEDYSESLLL